MTIPLPKRHEPRTYFLYAVCAAIFLFLMAPTVIVIPLSFSSARFLTFPPPGFSLQWYTKIFGSSEWMASFVTSVEIALATTLLSLVLGTLAALSIVRGRYRGKDLVHVFVLSPMIVPAVITALALYVMFVRLDLVDTYRGLILAHTVLAVPFVILNVSSALRGFDERLEQAAMIMGAGRIRTFFEVTYPLIRPGMLSGALLAFITSFDEAVVAIFLSETHVRTLPRKLWDGVRDSIEPTIAAASTLIIALSVLLLLIVQLLQKPADRA